VGATYGVAGRAKTESKGRTDQERIDLWIVNVGEEVGTAAERHMITILTITTHRSKVVKKAHTPGDAVDGVAIKKRERGDIEMDE
jgi:hypothetical protein